MRKPRAVLAPMRAPARAVEEFIAAKPKPRSPPAKVHGRNVIARKDGRLERRTTVRLSVELADRLEAFAHRQHLDQKDVIEAAIEDWLTREGG